ncbi:MAG: ABC transporter ATP-binding protein [Burkholderiaceae bacterium]|nr:ABC transporter ATP-binding protein [Burkholderiaceae bacterium]
MSAPLLQVRDLRVEFPTVQGPARAVDGVSFTLDRGRTLALVGESGSGKSVTASALLRLVSAPGRIAGGSVRLDGQELLSLAEPELRAVRGGRIAMVFQDALAALNPVQTIGAQILEALRLHHPPGQRFDRRAAWQRVIELLELVQIPAAAQRAHEYPHRLSGGMRQRAVIAMALAGNPELLIADEPTTALDVTTQAQILALLHGLKQRLGLALLLITHDLGVVAQVADEVAVMYAGRLVEQAPARLLFDRPAHPYSAALLDTLHIASLAPGSRLPEIPGQVPLLSAMPAGCAFAARCSQADAGCRRQAPALQALDAARSLACWRPLAPPQRRAEPVLEIAA